MPAIKSASFKKHNTPNGSYTTFTTPEGEVTMLPTNIPHNFTAHSNPGGYAGLPDDHPDVVTLVEEHVDFAKRVAYSRWEFMDGHDALSCALEGLWMAAKTYVGRQVRYRTVPFTAWAIISIRNTIRAHFQHSQWGKRGAWASIIHIDYPRDYDESQLILNLEDETADLPAAEAEIDNEINIVRKSLQSLPPQERQVLESRYGLNDAVLKTFKKINSMVGGSSKSERVAARLHTQALRRLHSLRESLETEYSEPKRYAITGGRFPLLEIGCVA